MIDLDRAWEWRERLGLFDRSEALRVFHGPGEGKGDFRGIAVDRFRDHYWVTEWEGGASDGPARSSLVSVMGDVVSFLEGKGAQSIVGLSRPKKGTAPESKLLLGNSPQERFKVREGRCEFLIQLEKTRHPGLFLDHEPLRRWLTEHCRELKVLNTFAYTGSLSVAAGRGDAKEVTTLDLSKSAISWAKENLAINGMTGPRYRLIAGDVFEWLPKFKRSKETFDCIILDPPSFARGKSGEFSTMKDLTRLHGLALDLLTPNGILITSINSANVTKKKYEEEVLAAAKSRKMTFQILQQLDLPETFPTPLEQSSLRYLKGWILRRTV